MKTRRSNQGIIGKVSAFFATVMLFLLSFAVVSAQDTTNVLFKSEVKVSEIWAPEVKINSIQGDVGTLIGFYGGALLNNSVLLGLSGGVNLSHPHVNYGYFGALGQYIFKPANLVHFSGQLLLAYGTTKDYEDPKSGLLDNFWNISGAGFFLMEPGINLELNLSRRLTLVAGASYRYATGLDENNENIQITHLTNNDLSGMNFNVGLKFRKVKKSEKK